MMKKIITSSKNIAKKTHLKFSHCFLHSSAAAGNRKGTFEALFYRFAFLNKNMAKMPKKIFGNHTAIKGEKVDCSAIVPKILSKNT